MFSVGRVVNGTGLNASNGIFKVSLKFLPQTVNFGLTLNKSSNRKIIACFHSNIFE